MSEATGKEVECPRCGYETLVFDEDLTELNKQGFEEQFVIHHCPECNPTEFGDPTTDKTPRLVLIEGSDNE